MLTTGCLATVSRSDGGQALRDRAGRHPKIGIVYNGTTVKVLGVEGNQAAVEVVPGSRFKMLSVGTDPRGLVPLACLSEVES